MILEREGECLITQLWNGSEDHAHDFWMGRIWGVWWSGSLQYPLTSYFYPSPMSGLNVARLRSMLAVICRTSKIKMPKTFILRRIFQHSIK